MTTLTEAEARIDALVAWRDRVLEHLYDLGSFEENAQLQPGRKACPFCRTQHRDEDDGAWRHHEWCPLDWSHDLYMTAPILPVTCRVTPPRNGATSEEVSR